MIGKQNVQKRNLGITFSKNFNHTIIDTHSTFAFVISKTDYQKPLSSETCVCVCVTNVTPDDNRRGGGKMVMMTMTRQ